MQYSFTIYFESIKDVPHKVDGGNKFVTKHSVAYQINIECSVLVNNPFSFSKKKLSHVRQYCGVYGVTLKQYSKTKFVSHYADLTMAAFNRMTNGKIHELEKERRVTNQYGRENLHLLNIVKSGHFQLNNRFYQVYKPISYYSSSSYPRTALAQAWTLMIQVTGNDIECVSVILLYR